MAVTKKEIYILEEIDWAEQKLYEWKSYVDANPFDTIKDRIEWKPTAKGSLMPMVIASKESQIKCVRDTMKEYLILLEQVNKMRQAEEYKKKEVRGGGEIPLRMRAYNGT